MKRPKTLFYGPFKRFSMVTCTSAHYIILLHPPTSKNIYIYLCVFLYVICVYINIFLKICYYQIINTTKHSHGIY